MSKHIPGPWTAEDNAVFSNRMCLAIGYGARIPANVRLMAAAPDLLAALKLYDEVMTAAWGEFDALPNEYSDRRRCWSAARAAIAKAEGGA